MHKLPESSVELIEKLNAEFPHRCPRVSDSERDIWLYAGKRALIDMMLSLAEASRVRIRGAAELSSSEEE